MYPDDDEYDIEDSMDPPAPSSSTSSVRYAIPSSSGIRGKSPAQIAGEEGGGHGGRGKGGGGKCGQGQG